MMAARKKLLEALGKMWNWLRPNVDRTTGGLTDGWGRVVARIEGSGLPSFPAYFVIVGTGFLVLHAVLRATFPAPVDAASTRYLLSAVAQSVAALGALTFAVMFVSLQIIAPRGGLALAPLVVRDRRFQLAVSTVACAIGTPLALLYDVQMAEQCPAYLPITGLAAGAIGVIAIVWYVWWRVSNLTIPALLRQAEEQAAPVLETVLRAPDNTRSTERMNEIVEMVTDLASEAIERGNASDFDAALQTIRRWQAKVEQAPEYAGRSAFNAPCYENMLDQRRIAIMRVAASGRYDLLSRCVYTHLDSEARRAYRRGDGRVWGIALEDLREFASAGARSGAVAANSALDDYSHRLRNVLRWSRPPSCQRQAAGEVAAWEERLLAITAQNVFFAASMHLRTDASPSADDVAGLLQALFECVFTGSPDFLCIYDLPCSAGPAPSQQAALDLQERVLLEWVRVVYGLAVETQERYGDALGPVAKYFARGYLPLIHMLIENEWISADTIIEKAVTIFAEREDAMGEYLDRLSEPSVQQGEPVAHFVRTYEMAVRAHLLLSYCLHIVMPDHIRLAAGDHPDQLPDLAQRCRLAAQRIDTGLIDRLWFEVCDRFRLDITTSSPARGFDAFVRRLVAYYD